MTSRLAPLLAIPIALLSLSARAEGLAEAMMAKLAAEPSREASFTEDKRLTSLTDPLHSRGRLIFVRATPTQPARLEKATETPTPERLVIEADQITITEPGKAPRSIALDEHPALRALADTLRATLAGDLPTLRRMYAVEEQGAPDAWRLLLMPVTPALRRALARVTLDGGGGDLRQIVIQFANGDEQRLTIQALTASP